MAFPAPTARPAGAGRDRGFHPLRVREVVRETADTTSIVLEAPEELRDLYGYDAGQFCTFRVVLDGQELQRCYSMSSSPAVGEPMQVTVKQVPGGAVSTWLNESLQPGDVLEASVPSGLFRVTPGDGDIVAFGAGSGITPIFSIVKTVLATTSRRVRLLYANRDRDSIIFRAHLDALQAEHPDRLTVVHHLDAERGFVGAAEVRALLEGADDPELFVCGPGPFMDVVERTLLDDGVPTDRIRIERFTHADADPIAEATEPEAPAVIEVTIKLGGKKKTGEHRHGTTILQTARQFGMAPPFSCEAGSCATCMARLVSGEVAMRTNNALTPEEVADGWVLTCQAVPTSASVHVVYE